MMLSVGIENTRFELRRVLPTFASLTEYERHHPHAIAAMFRQLGICRLLLEGAPTPLFTGQMQACTAYMYALPSLAANDKVTSWAGAFWDAVGGTYWDAATQIAQHSRSSHNPDWEHEDDFLHVWFLMNRYFLDTAPADDEPAEQACERRQRALLNRWEAVLEGGYDPRWFLCDALLRSDDESFREAFLDITSAREVELRQLVDDGKLSAEDTAWFLPIWCEGLALLRLAERDGLRTDQHCNMVPNVVRGANPFAYNGDAWRAIDFTPQRRL